MIKTAPSKIIETTGYNNGLSQNKKSLLFSFTLQVMTNRRSWRSNTESVNGSEFFELF